MDRLRTKTVFAEGRLTVAVAESRRFRIDGTERTRLMTGTLRPIAVIVNEGDRKYAFDMEGQPIDLDEPDLPADPRST